MSAHQNVHFAILQTLHHSLSTLAFHYTCEQFYPDVELGSS